VRKERIQARLGFRWIEEKLGLAIFFADGVVTAHLDRAKQLARRRNMESGGKIIAAVKDSGQRDE